MHGILNEEYTISLGLLDAPGGNQLCVRNLNKPIVDDGSFYYRVNQNKGRNNQNRINVKNDVHLKHQSLPHYNHVGNQRLLDEMDSLMNFYQFRRKNDEWFTKKHICINVKFKIELYEANGNIRLNRQSQLHAKYYNMIKITDMNLQNIPHDADRVSQQFILRLGQQRTNKNKNQNTREKLLKPFVIHFKAYSCNPTNSRYSLVEMKKLIIPTKRVRFKQTAGIFCPRFDLNLESLKYANRIRTSGGGNSNVAYGVGKTKLPFDYANYLKYTYASDKQLKRMNELLAEPVDNEMNVGDYNSEVRSIYRQLSVVFPFTGHYQKYFASLAVTGGSGEYIFEVLHHDIAMMASADDVITEGQS